MVPQHIYSDEVAFSAYNLEEKDGKEIAGKLKQIIKEKIDPLL